MVDLSCLLHRIAPLLLPSTMVFPDKKAGDQVSTAPGPDGSGSREDTERLCSLCTIPMDPTEDCMMRERGGGGCPNSLE